VAVAGAAACTEARPVVTSPTSTTAAVTLAVPGGAAAPGGAATPGASALQQLIGRLGDVDTSDLVLGAEFNRQFLGLQVQAVGLDAAEASCVADKVSQQVGADFGKRAVNQLMSGVGVSPDVMIPCVTPQRLAQLASSGGQPDLSKVPPDVVRSTFGELASAGFESVGLEPVEATCLSDKTVGALADERLQGLMTSMELDNDALTAAVPQCVSAERINELAGG
jgi:hypothetical protein